MAAPAFITYSSKPFDVHAPFLTLDEDAKTRSRIPVRSNSLPSMAQHLRRTLHMRPSKSSLSSAPDSNDSPSVGVSSSHSKSLSDSLPRIPKMSLTFGRSFFTGRSSRIPLPRRHTSHAAPRDDAADKDSDGEDFAELSAGRAHIPHFFPDTPPKEIALDIPRMSLLDEIQFPKFDEDDDGVPVSPFSSSRIGAGGAKLQPFADEEPLAEFCESRTSASEDEDEFELTEIEEEDVMLMRELMMGTVQLTV